MRVLIALTLWLALALPCSAQMTTLGAGGTKMVAAAAYTGPGDIVSGASGWWGLRAYNAAYATGSNSAAIVCDAATFLVCSTINILSNGKFDTATASGSAACATACVVKSLTDQTGNSNTATCASAAVCPTLTFNCLGTNPCLTFTAASSQTFTMTSINTPGSGGASISAVIGRTGTALGIVIGGGGISALGSNAAATGITQWVSGTVSATQTDNVIHAVQAVNNGASPNSYLNIDGTTTTGSSTYGAATIQTLGSGQGNFYNGKFEELGLYLSIDFTGTQANNLCHNQFAFWGTATSC